MKRSASVAAGIGSIRSNINECTNFSGFKVFEGSTKRPSVKRSPMKSNKDSKES